MIFFNPKIQKSYVTVLRLYSQADNHYNWNQWVNSIINGLKEWHFSINQGNIYNSLDFLNFNFYFGKGIFVVDVEFWTKRLTVWRSSLYVILRSTFAWLKPPHWSQLNKLKIIHKQMYRVSLVSRFNLPTTMVKYKDYSKVG